MLTALVKRKIFSNKIKIRIQVSDLVSGMEQSGFKPWPGYYVVFLGKTLKSHGPAIHPCAQIKWVMMHEMHAGVLTNDGLHHIHDDVNIVALSSRLNYQPLFGKARCMLNQTRESDGNRAGFLCPRNQTDQRLGQPWGQRDDQGMEGARHL